MPAAPKRRCSFPTCPELVDSGRCAQHSKDPEELRGKTAERGYDGVWRKFRLWFLKRHPICVDCETEGIVRAATEVHHVKKLKQFPELRLVESNVRGLCWPHHNIRTGKGE